MMSLARLCCLLSPMHFVIVTGPMGTSAAITEDVAHMADTEHLEADDECRASSSDPERQCGLSALQRRGKKLGQSQAKEAASGARCAPLSAPQNDNCREAIQWSSTSGKHDPRASEWYSQMELITGVKYTSTLATDEDWQRMYFCSPPGGKSCGTPPCTCTHPPCDSCLGGLPPPPKHKGCVNGSESIACKPPASPFSYKGMEWPAIEVSQSSEVHLFAIGDWGGLDGTLDTTEGRPRLIVYSWGNQPGPSCFPRSRWNAGHSVELCSHEQLVQCYQNHGKSNCTPGCGYVDSVDSKPQDLVAEAMKRRAARVDPALILNVGDNFYWGGIEQNCGTTPMDQISFTTWHQFDQIFEGVYQGKGLSGKPWLSVLGNHDWGGRQFNNGWDQQIAYTWKSDRWIMPAPYYMVRANFRRQYFSADIFMLDTNFNDAKYPSRDSEHNLCGSAHNPVDADCSAADGPPSVYDCPAFFQNLWTEQKAWLENKLLESTATWQIVVTHFPCGEDGAGQSWYRKLHTQYGLDLLVTGHRHDQELWTSSMTWKNRMGGLTCFVTGGGGGISSEATPDPNDKRNWFGEAQYGFYDLTVTRYNIRIESINFNGDKLKQTTVYPKRATKQKPSTTSRPSYSPEPGGWYSPTPGDYSGETPAPSGHPTWGAPGPYPWWPNSPNPWNPWR